MWRRNHKIPNIFSAQGVKLSHNNSTSSDPPISILLNCYQLCCFVIQTKMTDNIFDKMKAKKLK